MDGKKPILDGIVNLEEYFKSGIKILWILKEPYDKNDEGAYEWYLNKLLNDTSKVPTLGGLKTTWYPIVYTSYAILNGFQFYNDLEYIDKDPTMLEIFKKIAVINVQKFPARTTSNNREISAAYKAHSHILLEQIKTYNPDIVIGGNTMGNFIEDLGLNNKNKGYDEYDYWFKEKKLYIHAGHPAVRRGYEAKEAYVNDIVRIAKKHFGK